MSCDSGNKTLDPFQIVIDSTSSKINSLEKQSNLIVPEVTSFRTEGLGFNPANISPTATVNSAMNDFTADAICAGSSDLDPINQFTGDCLNEALAGVRRYTQDILGNIEDGIDLISSILALPENTLMKQIQKLKNLTSNISALINSIDLKIECITSLDESGVYTSQIQDLQDRVTAVTDALYLDADGSFNADLLMDGFEADLKTNVVIYQNRATALQGEIEEGIETTLKIPATINPRSRF